MAERISFIGGGNMAQALISGLIAAGHSPSAIAIADPDPAQRDRLARFAGVAVTAHNAEAVADSALVVLAVKPQAAPSALASIAEGLKRERPTLLSIAAGLRIATILAGVGDDLAVIRAMPNTPALIGRGASAWYAGENTDAGGRALARKVLEAAGIAIEVEQEAQLDAVTAVSGSGPAYFFLLVEALAEAGAAQGLSEEQATRLAAATGAGAMSLLAKSEESAATLRERVTSPGGTTAAALAIFADGDFRGLVARAVAAAAKRADELGKD
jgi:pyrroline-5-carboxylate reductase